MQIITNERYYFKSMTPPAMLTNPIAKLKRNILFYSYTVLDPTVQSPTAPKLTMVHK